MSRRTFLKSITALLGGMTLPTLLQAKPDLSPKPSVTVWKTLQTFPVAGFQYHQGESLWPLLATDQQLKLVREKSNRYDNRAVRIDWQGHKLGYVPRDENAAVAQLIDRGEKLEAVITGLNRCKTPWKRITVEVRWWV